MFAETTAAATVFENKRNGDLDLGHLFQNNGIIRTDFIADQAFTVELPGQTFLSQDMGSAYFGPDAFTVGQGTDGLCRADLAAGDAGGVAGPDLGGDYRRQQSREPGGHSIRLQGVGGAGLKAGATAIAAPQEVVFGTGTRWSNEVGRNDAPGAGVPQ